MLPKIIFCTAVSAATLAVILLALISPSVHKTPQKNHTKPWLALSLYIQHPHIPPSNTQTTTQTTTGAFIFHHTLTEGPQNTSRIVGRAQAFIIPIEHFSHSVFNIIYLTIDMVEYSGSLGIHAKNIRHRAREELPVVGGTGSFAFARGLAVFVQMEGQLAEVNAMYHVKLRLRFPNQTQVIPG
ncbi:disease resistance-responsive (dirigent-like protein) family protein [Tasmannia lanceolata]|uniref:disease resistance-responsive (dirigent-like protein) family protein n=1 Tax=Tasmannia lanceolata TaxID=3420 RepID=UPI004062D2B8